MHVLLGQREQRGDQRILTRLPLDGRGVGAETRGDREVVVLPLVLRIATRHVRVEHSGDVCRVPTVRVGNSVTRRLTRRCKRPATNHRRDVRKNPDAAETLRKVVVHLRVLESAAEGEGVRAIGN